MPEKSSKMDEIPAENQTECSQHQDDASSVPKVSKRAEREAKMKAEDDIIEAFINHLQLSPVIWNKEHKGHKNILLTQKTWENILNSLKKDFSLDELKSLKMDTVAGLKTKYRTLKDAYVRYSLLDPLLP